MTLWYLNLLQQGKLNQLWLPFIMVGVVYIILGFILRPYTGGISKIRATPEWVLIMAGIGTLSFVVAIYLIDVKGKQNWFKLLKPAGTSTLTCYLLPYLLYALYTLFGFRFPQVLSYGLGGFLRSLATAFFVIILVGLLERRKIRLRL